MIIQNLIKTIKNPAKAWRFLMFAVKYKFNKKKGILIYIGMDPSGTFNLMHGGFEKCYGFEANPERFRKIEKKYRNSKNVFLYNVAVADYNGEVTFNISNNNNGASSSIGNFDENWNETLDGKKIEMVESITVPCINLNTFVEENKIDFIDEYFSDIQGMDLTVLKTIKPLIDTKKIGTITCEVAKNSKRNIYKDLPDNSEKGFDELLNENYKLTAKGWGALKAGRFEIGSADIWEMDCQWQLKN